MLQSSTKPASESSQLITCDIVAKDLPPETSVINMLYSKQIQTTTKKKPPVLPSTSVDKIFNIVTFGIQESPPKTP